MSQKLYISSDALNKMDSHSNTDLSNEVGGFLVGKIKKDITYVDDFIAANSGESKSSSFKFTDEDWKSLYKEIEKSSEAELIGWFHTHPDFGTFLSSYDEFIQNNFFSDNGRVAIVFDPIRQEWSAFIQVNGETNKVELKKSNENKQVKIAAPKYRNNKLITSVLLTVIFASYSIYLYLNNLELKSEIISEENLLEETIENKNKIIEETKEEFEKQLNTAESEIKQKNIEQMQLQAEIDSWINQYNDLEIKINDLIIENEKLEKDGNYFSYIIKQGDTLNKIAEFFGVTIESIYSLNEKTIGEDINIIETGDILLIKIEK
tara:strand:- start:97 stop:1056 length:960 start_codon:yes stop_codon:yes gene_type:complete